MYLESLFSVQVYLHPRVKTSFSLMEVAQFKLRRMKEYFLL